MRQHVRNVSRAVALAGPNYLLTITRLTGEWGRDRKMVNRLVYYLRHRDHLVVHLAHATERNPKGDGYHIHAWGHGDELSPEILNNRARQVGLGRCDIAVVTYGGNFGYPLKTAVHNERSLAEFRRVNGREAIHGRNFWRDGRTGERLSFTEAKRRTRTHAAGLKEPWVLVAGGGHE